MRTINQILDFLKDKKGIAKEVELARLLDVRPNVVSTWRARDTMPYKELITLCEHEGWNISELLTGKAPKHRGDKEQTLQKTEDINDTENYVLIPQVSGEISAGGGLEPDNTIEMRIAFRKDWIQRKGNPESMSLIRVSGDSMEPTLLSGDMVLIDHNRNYFEPDGGIYAISLNNHIMIKRLQLIHTSNILNIISDNGKYKIEEVNPEAVTVNGKVIWYGREIER